MEDFVYIIESPSDKDLLDGRTEGRVLAEALNLADIDYSYNLVTTKESLQTALYERLPEAINSHGKYPILHFSGHGNTSGIGLTDNTNLEWNELSRLLLPIKQQLDVLLICMSSCYGGFAHQMAKESAKDNVPFTLLIGNDDAVDWHDAAIAYITFYHLFFKGLNIQDCFKAMKSASNNFNFRIWNGEEIQKYWSRYQKNKGREFLNQYLAQYRSQKNLFRHS